MDLKTYYKQLEDKSTLPPKTKFLQEVMTKTGKNRATVYRWLNGTALPDLANMNVLATITGIAVDKLFPVEEKQEN